MSARQRGLGRGLGALIAPPDAGRVARGQASSPSDVFFNGSPPVIRLPDTVAPGGSAETEVPIQEAAAAATGETTAAATTEATTEGQIVGELRLVPVTAIVPNSRQPRTDFDEGALEELAASIQAVGVLQPVVVRAVSPGSYELVMGERRWRASQRAGLAEIPAVIRATQDDELLREALLENLHRSELNPLEEGAAYSQLLTDFACTHEELALRLGRSRSHLTNTMRLLGLPPGVQRRVAAGVLSAGHARALLTLADGAAQEALAARIVAEGLSVRATEELVAMAGSDSPRAPRRRAPRPDAPELGEIAAALTEHLDTRVKIAMGRTKGRITVEFAGVDDLQRILSAMNSPEAPDRVAEQQD